MRLLGLDITRARERLGWVPRIDLDTGMAETIRWFRAEMGS